MSFQENFEFKKASLTKKNSLSKLHDSLGSNSVSKLKQSHNERHSKSFFQRKSRYFVNRTKQNNFQNPDISGQQFYRNLLFIFSFYSAGNKNALSRTVSEINRRFSDQTFGEQKMNIQKIGSASLPCIYQFLIINY